ncbi:MAG: carboxypeptidase regulatory-like domain-containing protein [bacterium]|nr:carboxypeptidase regulatory-like domain-containing protein [bacterium]
MPEGLRAVLVGEMEGIREGDNHFKFKGVFPGEHTLYVYGERGTVGVSEFATDTASSHIELEFMIDLCIGTELTPIRGVVTDGDGKPVAGAVVAATDLFIETVTDENGGYELKFPPGEWTINVTIDGKTAKKRIALERPEMDSDVPALEVDLMMD